ncbi:hypothetical protein EV363DRAFT_1335567 [Boletus edulis]|nr:hypothetical protein EV363DRAFT_1335567 [Boletus edulis]
MREFTVDGSQLHPEHSTLRNQDHGDDKRISYAPSGTCYIANIPAANSSRTLPSSLEMVPEFQGTSEAEVQPMFGSYVDDILAARFDKKEQSRNIFIQFRGVDIATEAMEAFRSQNEDIQIRYARQRNPQPTRTVLHLDYRNSGLNRCDIGF